MYQKWYSSYHVRPMLYCLYTVVRRSRHRPLYTTVVLPDSIRSRFYYYYYHRTQPPYLFHGARDFVLIRAVCSVLYKIRWQTRDRVCTSHHSVLYTRAHIIIIIIIIVRTYIL